MLNPVVASSCYSAPPSPASSDRGFIFPSAAAAAAVAAAAASKSHNLNPYPISNIRYYYCKEHHVNSFRGYRYFNSTSCFLRHPCSGSFVCSSVSGFCCSLSRTRGGDGNGNGNGNGNGERDKKVSTMGLTDLDFSAARKIPRLNAAVLGESLATEDDNVILPSDQFSSRAHVSSYLQVRFSLLVFFASGLDCYGDHLLLNSIIVLRQYLEMYQRSIEDPAGFWSDIASSEFFWKKKWDQQVYSENLDVRKGEIKIEVSLKSDDLCPKSTRSLTLISSFNTFSFPSSGSKVESPTFVTTASIGISRLD